MTEINPEVSQARPKRKQILWAGVLVAAIIVIIVGGYFLFFGYNRSAGLTKAISSDPNTTIGTQTTMDNVGVKRAGDSDTAFWAESGRDHILVLTQFDAQSSVHAANGGELHDGQRVTLKGYIRKMLPKEELKSSWKLSEDDATTAAAEKVYLDATNITVQK